MLAASFPKFGHPAFAWGALAPLVVAVALATAQRATAGRVFALGLTAGAVYFGGTLYWVVAVMAGYGGLAIPVAVLVGLLLAAYLSLYPALFALLVRRAVQRFGVAGVWLAPLFWVSTEWVRATIGGGFPWVLLGASQASVLPVVQFASLVGVYGLSALVALVATAAAACTLSRETRHRRGAFAVALLLAVISGWGTWRVADSSLTTQGDVTRIGLVQGSVAQEDKYDPAHRAEIMARYIDLSRQVLGARADLVIWPEAATPFYFDIDSVLAQPIRKLAAEAHTPFLIGTDELDRATPGQRERYYNAAVLVGSDGRTKASYRKQHLVPFGEYVPLKSVLFFVGPLVEAVSDFSAGAEAVVFDANGRRLSVAICYESVYPSIARAFVNQGSELLATITNDAWFGRSSAAYQHFSQGALRAVEQGRYVVRAANTGISGAVDPYGRVLAATPLFEPATVTVDVHLLRSHTIYNRTGDVVAWVALAATALVVAVGVRRPIGQLPSSTKDPRHDA
ncbi:MAG: apolipoprotein N-acyltransferase [Vicinamibacterales bacterium]